MRSTRNRCSTAARRSSRASGSTTSRPTRILGPPVQRVADDYDWLKTQAVDGHSPIIGVPTSPEELRAKVDLVHHGRDDGPRHLHVDHDAGHRGRAKLTEHRAAVRRADQRLHRGRPAARHPHHPVHHRRQGRPLAARRRSQDDPDAYVHVVDRSPDGVVIRGAKLHITGASLGHELMTIPTKAMKAGEEDYAIAAMVPVNAPGREDRQHDLRAAPRGHPRLPGVRQARTTPEGFVIFDDVFVPNERIFLDGEVSSAAVFAHSLGLWERLGGLTGMADGADVLVGLAQLIAEANGLAGAGPHQGEDLRDDHPRHRRAGRASRRRSPTPRPASFGAAFPERAVHQRRQVHRRGELQPDGAPPPRHRRRRRSSPRPSIADLENPEIGHLARKYMSTMNGVDGEYRTRLFHAIRDLTADSYGGWQPVTNIQAGGGLYAQRIVTRKHYDLDGAKQVALAAAGLADAAH